MVCPTTTKDVSPWIGTITGINNNGLVTSPDWKIRYTASLYLNGKNNADVFSYRLLGSNMNDTGRLTIIVTPLTNTDLQEWYKKYSADECKDGTSDCEQLCLDGTPTPGYICGCRPGYTLVGKYYCQDIDECATSKSGCDWGCTNLPGSHTCDCEPGWGKNLDGVCQELPCPFTPWVLAPLNNSTPPNNLLKQLPTFIKVLLKVIPGVDTSRIPGVTCYSCDSKTTEIRTITAILYVY